MNKQENYYSDFIKKYQKKDEKIPVEFFWKDTFPTGIRIVIDINEVPFPFPPETTPLSYA
jgi:hypothetical protein